MTRDGEIVTSQNAPVIHAPREPCGGGSCWAAGFIDAQVVRTVCSVFDFASVLHPNCSHQSDCPRTLARLGIVQAELPLSKSIRRADILAAMAQVGPSCFCARAFYRRIDDTLRRSRLIRCRKRLAITLKSAERCCSRLSRATMVCQHMWR